jgi:hypothetical protein
MTSYLRGLFEMQDNPKYCGVCDATLDTYGRCHSGHNYQSPESDLEALRAAVRDFFERPITSNRRRLAELAGITMIEPSEPGSYKQARGIFLEIENADPVGDMLELQGLSRCCECPLDPDTGFCPCCADDK